MADEHNGTNGANTGGALEQELRMYVYRKGETVAREVKYNAQEGIFVMGEMLDNPPAVSSAPTGTSPLGHFYGTNKHEVTDEDLQRDEKVLENREPKRENDEHWKKSTYLHDKAAERAVESAAVIERQNEKKEVSQEDERVHPDQQRDIDRKISVMVASYEASHGQDQPLTDKGRDNIRELCTNYVNSQNKLKGQDFTTFEQPKLASDTLAYGMMQTGLEQKDAARTLWDANNVHYADNMRFLAQSTSDYQHLVGQSQEDSSVFRDNLIDPQKQNLMRQRAFAEVQGTVQAAEQRYAAQRKKPEVRPREEYPNQNRDMSKPQKNTRKLSRTPQKNTQSNAKSPRVLLPQVPHTERK